MVKSTNQYFLGYVFYPSLLKLFFFLHVAYLLPYLFSGFFWRVEVEGGQGGNTLPLFSAFSCLGLVIPESSLLYSPN